MEMHELGCFLSFQRRKKLRIECREGQLGIDNPPLNRPGRQTTSRNSMATPARNPSTIFLPNCMQFAQMQQPGPSGQPGGATGHAGTPAGGNRA